MPPGLLVSRPSRYVACLVLAVGTAVGPASWAHGDGRTITPVHRAASVAVSRPSEPPGESPSAVESPLAGRQAGEGRARPGRSLSPDEIADSEAAADEMPPDADPAGVPAFTPPPDAFPEPGETARQRQALDEPRVRQVRDVSLGSGIALVGMGLGFLAVRMRRTT
ncbi:hypothetical protein [Streptomyces sp. NPDC057428]|uniref:hypothetical protein n=1 Tax=Streptomyces sp. NPDC057428 TaxID=3346129 RepID=UPI00369BB525